MEAEARNLAALSRKAGGAPGASARVSIAKYQGANMAGKVRILFVMILLSMRVQDGKTSLLPARYRYL